MKRMRLHLISVICLFAVLFTVGCFFDLNLSSAIASSGNEFALGVSSIGVLPGHIVLSMIGGFCLYEAFKDKIKTFLKVIFFCFGCACASVADVMAGSEIFGVNGFYGVLPEWVGYLIVLPVICASAFLGFKIYQRAELKGRIALIIIVGVMAATIMLIGGVFIKLIFRRPRFRAIDAYGIPFVRVFSRFDNYKEYMEKFGILSDEFKSFPSGHTATSAVFPCFVVFLPLIKREYEKIQLNLFYFGVIFTLFVAYNRILAGAHFLTDIAFGGLLAFTCAFITNEITIRLKVFQNND